MKGYYSSIEKDTLENDCYRKVVYTGHYLQIVLMSLNVGEEIGSETHATNDQFFRFESGHGKCMIDSNEYVVKSGDAVLAPAGAKHNVINTSLTEKLTFYTIYAPPNHEQHTVRQRKSDAEKNPEEFDGLTSE